MAQQQMTSLFGPTPQDLLRQQQQADQELAMRQAQLGPGQGLMYQAASAGQRAGRNIAGLFGVEDPRLKEASAMQELKTAINTQWDGTDPVEAYKIMAKEAARLGLTQQSLAAAMQVKQAEEAKTKTGLETEVKKAQIGKYVAQTGESEAKARAAEREKLTSPFGKVDPDKFTPESLNKFQQSGNYQDLVPVDPTKYTDPYMSTGADGKPILVQRNLKTNQVEPVDKASKVSVSATAMSKQDEGINKAKVKRLDDLENSAVAADSVLTNVNAISSVLNNAFTGVGAGVALKAGQIANALGVQVTGTTESEQLNQLLAKLAQGQARTLPGSLSEKELMFLREAIGTGGMTKQTLQAMLRRMREDAISDKEAYKDAFKFQQGGGNLNNYDFAESRTKARSTARRISDLLEKATPEQRRQLGY
jgi:hypothetical protein